MAFNSVNTANKTAFSVEFHSRKSDTLIGWFNLADSAVVKLFDGKRTVRELTAKEVSDKFGTYFNNDNMYAIFTDTTAERPVIALEDF